jgi:biopolymer transport protein ExbD
MKVLFIAGLFSALSLQACGQKVDAGKVPSVVVNALTAKYNTATDTEWEEKENHYEAEFTLNGKELEVQIDQAGKILVEKSDIQANELPAAVTAALQSAYKEYQVDDAEKLDRDGMVYYQVELEARGKKDLKKIFMAEGGEEKSLSYWD